MATQTEYYEGIKIPKYLKEGFTITMWVKFLDKVNKGTLFNYGSPLRTYEPHGFMLETFVLNKDDHSAPGTKEDGTTFFSNDNSERFVRLVVREADGSLRDSHVGMPWFNRINTGIPPSYDGVTGLDAIPELDNPYEAGLWTHVNIPIDFDEWYFIVASYDPLVSELNSYNVGHDNTPDFWRGHIDHTNGNESVHKSDYGSRCKVEVISKSQLLRARGYKPQEQ
jgi:hypothetical protein